MQSLTSSPSNLTPEGWRALELLTRREFSDGELESLTGRNVGYTLEKAMSYPIAVTRVHAKEAFSYRRTSKHIRNNRVGFRVIWFIKRGSLKIVRSCGVTQIDEGEAAIINTNLPFHCTSIRDAEGQFESLQVLVPADMFLAHLKSADQFQAPFTLDNPEGELVSRILGLVVEQGEHISRGAARPLAESLLQALGQCIGEDYLESAGREKLVDKRFADIESYILMNVTDPDLSYDKVAASCGISPRYLCYLLKAHNTSFSELLWKNRLPKARDWLISPTTRDYPIHEISFMSGFKSAAHFSRMFKTVYGCPPSEFRARNGGLTILSQDNVDLDESCREAA